MNGLKMCSACDEHQQPQEWVACEVERDALLAKCKRLQASEAKLREALQGLIRAVPEARQDWEKLECRGLLPNSFSSLLNARAALEATRG